jgi:lipopolysaccharide export system protein LptC
MLEKPMADITLKDGTWLSVEANKGAYRQQSENLLLEDNVKLFHDDGYEIRSEKLLVDMQGRKAWSDKDVTGNGPAGSIKASGMQANSENNKLVFTGPVTLVLNRKIDGL